MRALAGGDTRSPPTLTSVPGATEARAVLPVQRGWASDGSARRPAWWRPPDTHTRTGDTCAHTGDTRAHAQVTWKHTPRHRRRPAAPVQVPDAPSHGWAGVSLRAHGVGHLEGACITPRHAQGHRRVHHTQRHPRVPRPSHSLRAVPGTAPTATATTAQEPFPGQEPCVLPTAGQSPSLAPDLVTPHVPCMSSIRVWCRRAPSEPPLRVDCQVSRPACPGPVGGCLPSEIGRLGKSLAPEPGLEATLCLAGLGSTSGCSEAAAGTVCSSLPSLHWLLGGLLCPECHWESAPLASRSPRALGRVCWDQRRQPAQNMSQQLNKGPADGLLGSGRTWAKALLSSRLGSEVTSVTGGTQLGSHSLWLLGVLPGVEPRGA